MTQKQVDELARLKEVDVSLDHYESNQTLETKRSESGFVWHIVELVGVFILSLAIYYAGVYMKLKTENKFAYDWYDGTKMKSCEPDEKGRYGYRRGPTPEGKYRFDMNCISISDNYALLSSLLNGVGLGCGYSLNETQCEFLLLVMQVLFRDLEGIHWCGSADQLGYSSAQEWVKSWQAWNVEKNPFRFMLTEDEFDTSVAILQAQKSWEGSYLNSLYFGGLCNVAVEQYKDTLEPTDMVKELLGVQPVYYRSCYDQRMANAISQGTTAASYTLAAAGVARRTQRALSEVQKEKMLNQARIARKVKLGVEVKPEDLKSPSTLMRVIKGPKGTYSTVGKLSKAATNSATRVAARVTGRAAASAGEAADGAEAAASSVGEIAGAASADAVGGVTECISGGMEAGGVCGPFFFICGPIFALIACSITFALLATMFVGLGVGAAAALNFKCKGGQYYVLLQEKDGKTKRYKWNGDPSMLPGKLGSAGKDDGKGG